MRNAGDMVVLLSANDRAAQSLARLIRGESIYCRILPADTEADDEAIQAASGLILCAGGTGEAAQLPFIADYVRLGIPLMALGDAALTLCECLGGSLAEKLPLEGVQTVRFAQEDPLVGEMPPCERYLPLCRTMNPGGAGLVPVAESDAGVLGIRRAGSNVYGFAFQVEQNDPEGMTLLREFCARICGCTPWWSTHTFIQRAEEEIADLADDGEALCAISGGVDSSVCAMLANMALGHRLHCLLIDTGLMRKGEAEQVERLFSDMGLNVHRINAAEAILQALAGVTDPEEKERLVFANLRAILRREVSAHPEVRVVLQGTNYADSMRSEPPFPVDIQNARVRIVEPVRDLFKDEIRRTAEELQLPLDICLRQPFPASGLALRIRGEVTEEKLRVLREADAIFRDEVESGNQQKKLKQYYAALLDNPVPGEAPWLIQLRATQTSQEATMAARLPMDLLERTAERIMQAENNVRRVMYDLTPSRKLIQQREENRQG